MSIGMVDADAWPPVGGGICPWFYGTDTPAAALLGTSLKRESISRERKKKKKNIYVYPGEFILLRPTHTMLEIYLLYYSSYHSGTVARA